MSCWVVPTIAAELWGVAVNRVLGAIRDGTIASRDEHGFVFVDAADPGDIHHLASRPLGPTPPTFVVVSHDETVETDPELPPLDEEEDDVPLPPREKVRRAVSQLRKPPPAA
jgi:hypothetical protein